MSFCRTIPSAWKFFNVVKVSFSQTCRQKVLIFLLFGRAECWIKYMKDVEISTHRLFKSWVVNSGNESTKYYPSRNLLLEPVWKFLFPSWYVLKCRAQNFLWQGDSWQATQISISQSCLTSEEALVLVPDWFECLLFLESVLGKRRVARYLWPVVFAPDNLSNSSMKCFNMSRLHER